MELMEFIAKVTDQELKEKTERLRKQSASSITLKLPDKGENLRRSLKICEEELARRIQLQPTKIISSDSPCKAECEKANDSPQKSECDKAMDSPQKDECNPVTDSPHKVECDKALHLAQKTGRETAEGSPEKDDCENSNHSPKRAQNDSPKKAGYENSMESTWEAHCRSPKQSKYSPGEKESPWLRAHSPDRAKESREAAASPSHKESSIVDRMHCQRSKSIETPNKRSRHDESPRSSRHRDESLRPSRHRDESPRPSRHRDECPRPSCHRDESPRPSRHRDESARSYRDRDVSPRPYQRRWRDYPIRHSTYRPRQADRTPSVQSILHTIRENPSISRTRRLSREPSESQMEELVSNVYMMREQFENVQILLTIIQTQFTTRMDKLESKLEEIIRVQTGEQQMSKP